MIQQLDRYLSRGMYSVAEAALYARVSPQLVGRWMFARNHAITPEIQGSSERIVTFADFIQLLTVRQLRLRPAPKRVGMEKVRQAIEFLDRQGITVPFARYHTLYTFERDIVYKHPQHGYLFVTGREVNQELLQPVVEPHLDRITYADDGVAGEYVIHREGGIQVRMRPGLLFGEPVMPSGYSAKTLWEASTYEGGIEQAAVAYGVSPDEVRVAFDFYDQIQRAA